MVVPVLVQAELRNAPPGHYRAMAVNPAEVAKWRDCYGTTTLGLATRDIFSVLQPDGARWKVYLVPIRGFAGQHREEIEAVYAAMSGPMRKVFYELGAEYGTGPVVPIPIVGTIVWRAEDEQQPAWPGEMV